MSTLPFVLLLASQAATPVLGTTGLGFPQPRIDPPGPRLPIRLESRTPNQVALKFDAKYSTAISPDTLKNQRDVMCTFSLWLPHEFDEKHPFRGPGEAGIPHAFPICVSYTISVFLPENGNATFSYKSSAGDPIQVRTKGRWIDILVRDDERLDPVTKKNNQLRICSLPLMGRMHWFWRIASPVVSASTDQENILLRLTVREIETLAR